MPANNLPKMGDNTCYYYKRDVADGINAAYKNWKGSKSELVCELVKEGLKHWPPKPEATVK